MSGSVRGVVAVLAAVTLAGPLAATSAAGSAVAGAAAGTVAPLSLSAVWSSGEVVVGRRATVSGEVRPHSAVRKVVLQRETPNGWTAVASVAPAGADYTLRIPTGWYGRFTYRVRAVGTSGSASTVSASKLVRVVPSYDPRGSRKAHRLAAKPVARWDSCEVIGYRVNAGAARPGAVKDVKGALRRVSQATGLRFRNLGKTRIVPKDYYNTYPRGTDLVVAWAKPSQSPLLTATGGNPLGVGGAAWTLGFENADGTPASRIESGYVVLDATRQGRTPAGFGRGTTRGELLMHEIGHAIGLQHVDERTQLMYPVMQAARARWGAGDLAGLAKVGANRGCLSE